MTPSDKSNLATILDRHQAELLESWTVLLSRVSSRDYPLRYTAALHEQYRLILRREVRRDAALRSLQNDSMSGYADVSM